MVTLACSDAVFTSRVVRDVCQTMRAEGLRAQALRALSGSRCPPLFNFFVVNPWSPVNGHSRVSSYRPTGVGSNRPTVLVFLRRLTSLSSPKAYIRTLHTRRFGGRSAFILTRAQRLAQAPLCWAYGSYTSNGRSLRRRGTTLVKEIVLLLWDPVAQYPCQGKSEGRELTWLPSFLIQMSSS